MKRLTAEDGERILADTDKVLREPKKRAAIAKKYKV